MSLKCITIEPKGQFIFKTTTFGDKIILKKPKTGIFNLIMGERYSHHFGTLSAKNVTTGDYAEILLKEKPFFGTPDSTCQGFIKNSKGEEKYKIKGDWKTHIDFYDSKTNKKIPGMQKIADLARFDENYGMPLISRNGNYLTEEGLRTICPTDSRFRSDQRAAEYGDFDLAGEEKERLEEYQREREAEMEENGVEWRPRWFEKVFDEDFGIEVWTYKGGYFEARRQGEWEGVSKIY